VILFDNTADSLQEFVDSFVEGEAHIVENIEERVEEFDEGLPTIA
jgi:hypothetical protein